MTAEKPLRYKEIVGKSLISALQNPGRENREKAGEWPENDQNGRAALRAFKRLQTLIL